MTNLEIALSPERVAELDKLAAKAGRAYHLALAEAAKSSLELMGDALERLLAAQPKPPTTSTGDNPMPTAPALNPTAPAVPATPKAAPPTNTPENSSAAIRKAESDFAEARNLAAGRKQAAMAAAMKLPMPDHLAAIRKAERDYHLALATAADASGGIIASAPYHAAAAA